MMRVIAYRTAKNYEHRNRAARLKQWRDFIFFFQGVRALRQANFNRFTEHYYVKVYSLVFSYNHDLQRYYSYRLNVLVKLLAIEITKSISPLYRKEGKSSLKK